MTVQKLVYGCRNVHLTTVTNIEAPLTRHVQQVQQITNQPASQAALIERSMACHLLALDFFITLKHTTQHTSQTKDQTQMVYWY